MSDILSHIRGIARQLPGKTFRYIWKSKESKNPSHLRFNGGAGISYMRDNILTLSDGTCGSYERLREWAGEDRDEHEVIFKIDARIFDGETELSATATETSKGGADE